MKRKLLGLAAIFALVAPLATACGGDDDDDSSSGSAVLQKCKDVCAAQDAGGCLVLFTLEDCQSLCDLVTQAPADCATATEAVADCQLAATDICSATCDAETQAQTTACQ